MQELEAFTEEIARVVRDAFGSYGKNIFVPNAFSAIKDVGNSLQRATMNFALIYHDRNASVEQVQTAGKQIEAALLTGTVLGALTAVELDKLIDKLYNLMETR